jgi:hypothetical protein
MTAVRARFVMVDYGYDGLYGNLWDNHNVAAQNFPHISEMAKRGYHVAGMDKAFAALPPDGARALQRDLTDLLNRMNVGGVGSLVVPSEYVEVVITRH